MKYFYTILLTLITLTSYSQSFTLPQWYDITNIDVRKNLSGSEHYGSDSSVTVMAINADTNGISGFCMFIGANAEYYRCTFIDKDSTWTVTNVLNLDSTGSGSGSGDYSPWDTTVLGIVQKDTTLDVIVSGNFWQADIFNDSLLNTAGAGPYRLAQLPADPLDVFRYNDTLVQSNNLRDGLFHMTGSTGIIMFNEVSNTSTFFLTGSGDVQYNQLFGMDVNAVDFTGNFNSNKFATAFYVEISEASGVISSNEGNGSTDTLDIFGTSGNVQANKIGGVLRFTNSSGNNIGNIIEHGAKIFVDSMSGSINANVLQTGAIVRCSYCDSSVSKNIFRFTVDIMADSSQDRIEYAEFIGGFGTYAPQIYAKRNLGHPIEGATFYFVDNTNLDPDYTYENIIWSDRKVGIGVAQAKVLYDLHVDGNIMFTHYPPSLTNQKYTFEINENRGGVYIATEDTASQTISIFSSALGISYLESSDTTGGGNSTRAEITAEHFAISRNSSTILSVLDNNVRYTDGLQGVGKVLTSDAAGNASWQPQGAQSFQSASATDGGTTNANGSRTLKLKPAGLIAAHTVNFPATPVNGQLFSITGNGNTITTLTLAAGANTIIGALTTIATGGATWVYDSADSEWTRVD